MTDERMIKNCKKIVKKTIKTMEKVKVSEIQPTFKDEMNIIKKYVFYVNQQLETLIKKI